MKNLILGIVLCTCVFSCDKPRQQKDTAINTKIEAIQFPEQLNALTRAHQLTKFHEKEVVAFDISLRFGGQLRLEGTIYSRTNSTAVLVDKTNGTQLLFDGKEVYISSDTASTNGVRFDALTWSYFALAPFKFKDAGTNWTKNGQLPLDSGKADYPSLKLTFGENIGDAPDDWYIIFQDEKTQLLKAMAYIVTFGNKTQAEAAKNPHAIFYSDYSVVEEVPFATNWKFYNWNATDGLGAQLGEAKLTNIRFIDETDSLFAKALNAQLVPLK